MREPSYLMSVFLVLCIVSIGLFIYGLGVRKGESKCKNNTNPVAAFIATQPDIALDLTETPADKNPKRGLKKKGW